VKTKAFSILIILSFSFLLAIGTLSALWLGASMFNLTDDASGNLDNQFEQAGL